MKKNNNVERVVAYQMAREVTHDELEHVSGGAGMGFSVRTRLTGGVASAKGGPLGSYDTMTVFD